VILPGGLVLEGGGLRGNYTAGVLDVFLDEGIEFPYVIGVSAGAGMGCSYVSKQRGRNLEILKRYRRDPRYLSFRSFITTGNLFGLDFIFHNIAEELVPFDFEAFNKASSRFVTVCTDCETGKAVYYEKEIDLFEVLKASAALPYISKIVTYGNRKLLDGAITDAIPLKKAVEAGYTHNVVILTRPEGYRKKENAHPPARLVYRQYPQLVKALKAWVETYNRSMEQLEEEERTGKVLVIRPSRDLKVTRAEKSIKKLIRLYELGISDGMENIKKLKKLWQFQS
jgi:predicted patatin/cPLA2 family phospholipase